MSKSFDESGGNGTVYRPLSVLGAIIEATSPGDFLLYMVAQYRKEKLDLLAVPENNFVEIGKND